MPQKYFQVIPLYLRDDDAIVHYFNEYKSEIDAVTHGSLEVALPRPVAAGDAKNVISATDSDRYPGLKVDDLPCLWAEGTDDHLVVRLRNNADQVKQAIRELSASGKNAKSFRELKENYMAKQPAPDGLAQKVPPWFAIAGYAAGLLTLLFLMALVVAGIMTYGVPCNTRMLVVFVISLGLALASSFIGGDQAAKGSLPIPFVKEHPIAFTVTAGVAVFVVALLLGFYTYAKDCKDEPRVGHLGVDLYGTSIGPGQPQYGESFVTIIPDRGKPQRRTVGEHLTKNAHTDFDLPFGDYIVQVDRGGVHKEKKISLTGG
jgi:hypothetical protein